MAFLLNKTSGIKNFGGCSSRTYLRSTYINKELTLFINNQKISIFYGCKNETATPWV